MIGSLTGTLVRKDPNQVMIDVGGVGYELEVSMHTYTSLPAVGESVTLTTHLLVREDAHQLYGFWHEAERMAYRQLIKTNGIGPRSALAILSTFSVGQLAQAVANKDAKLLTRVPGIGAKTADRLLIELKDRFDIQLSYMADQASSQLFSPTALNSQQSAFSEVKSALIALGYKESEVNTLMRNLPEPANVEEGIRQALKAFARQ